MTPMRSGRRLGLIALVAAVAIAGGLAALPELLRHVAISRIAAMTHRQVRIDRVDVNLWTGRLAVHGFHLADRTGGPGLTDFEQLVVRLRPGALLRGHLWIREAILSGSTVRVVRSPDGFNISDLVQSSGPAADNLDVTVDRFTLVGGTVTFEDQALAEPRTWTSEGIHIEARNVSTRHDRGAAEASSVTAGAPVSIALTRFRLFPIHFDAALTVSGLDLSMARLYFPPDAPVVVDQGRASTSLRVSLDARGGLRADGTGGIEGLVLVRPGTKERLLLVPKMTSRLADFALRDGQIALGRFELTGSASALDPTARGGPRFEASTVRASIADLTWPIATPARLELETSAPGGGTVVLAGAVRPPPAASQLRLRVAGLSLAHWARLLPIPARISGVAEADLGIDEPLAAGVPARVRGSIAVNNLGVSDAGREVLGARRVEATGLEVRWPARLAVRQLAITAPRVAVERDKTGDLSLRRLWTAPAPAPTAASVPGLSIAEIAVRDGAVVWRDAAVTPPVRLDFSGIDARVTGAAWPPRELLGVRVAASPPGGGRLEVQGRVGADPLAADLRVAARAADVSPYMPYVPTAAHVTGWADLDLAVRLPQAPEERVTVRGTAALSRVDVRDEQRTVARLERAVATDVDVVWPERAAIRELTIRRPWVLAERDEGGALTLRALLPGAIGESGSSEGTGGEAGGTMALAVGRLVIEEGGARVVDRSLSPPFALDLSRLALGAEGLATAPAKPARVTLSARLGSSSLLDLEGKIGPLGGPLQLDVNGTLQGFWVPRTDPYVLRYVGWQAREGWLTSRIRCRIDKDVLDARSEIRLNRLAVAPGSRDEAQRRIGLPLGLIVALMKDSRGDIRISLPVGGRLGDPRFDFSEAIWSTVKNAAIKAITLPVSWIGRVHMTQDSRIERIEVNPVRFEPGTATPTPDGQAQLSRLAQFLDQAPEARMVLTPMVSRDDLAALGRRLLHSELESAARGGLSMDAAARRLFQQRLPGRTPPETTDAVVAALTAGVAPPPAAVAELAAQRIQAIRTAIKKAGVVQGRLRDAKPVEGPEAADSQVALDLAEPESPDRPGRRLPDFLHRLGADASGSAPARG